MVSLLTFRATLRVSHENRLLRDSRVALTGHGGRDTAHSLARAIRHRIPALPLSNLFFWKRGVSPATIRRRYLADPNFREETRAALRELEEGGGTPLAEIDQGA